MNMLLVLMLLGYLFGGPTGAVIGLLIFWLLVSPDTLAGTALLAVIFGLPIIALAILFL